MKNLKKLIIIIASFSIACSTTNEIKIIKTDLNDSSKENVTIEINFTNLTEVKKEIEINLNTIDYISKDDYKFGSKYKFSETLDNNTLKIKIPKGKYVGSIELKLSKTIPFYSNQSGSHTVYFGINEQRIKENIINEKCNSNESYSFKKLKSSKFSNFCNDLDVLNKKYSINFSLDGKIDFNPTKTLALTYVGLSIGLAKSFQYYQLAPFLLISGYFGFIQNDMEIKSEILEEAL
ncbi:hypothetical protein [Leptospira vanthielii]|uniref:Lipoprotein n=1 Tax=Leptospira vanthielii TaxID=293085 RepID=A0ABY2NU64_9LEPT|nr:hypothetical protein [Leptospira vanthielii]TGM61901.1 hypothetical protein EHQ95_00030 [Leptospira vanthielii]